MEIKYRTWYGANPPKKIKIEIPGWAGHDNYHGDGGKVQPWHCVPFVEGSTYGCELIYPFESTCHAKNNNGLMEFNMPGVENEVDLSENNFPFSQFAEGHYGMTSGLDLKPPEGHVTRLEPHPSYFLDRTGDIPCCLIGHIKRFWPRIFFVVFKMPPNGQENVFEKGMPYGQVIFVPEVPGYHLKEMSALEKERRILEDNKVTDGGIADRKWKSAEGYDFDNKYMKLNTIYKKQGCKGVTDFLSVKKKTNSKIGKFVKPNKD